MRGLHAIWFALIVLAFLAALTLWIDRIVQVPSPKRDGSARHDADYIVNNFLINRTDADGNPRYSLAGADMRHYPDNDTTDVLKPVFHQLSVDKPAIQVQGDRGQISPNGENVYFMDNVKLVRAATPQKGELTVLTEFLHAIPDQGILKTDKPVTILQAPRTVIRAIGMELDKQERTLKLLNRVRVHYERPDAPPLPPLTMDQVTGKTNVSAQSAKKQAVGKKSSIPKKNLTTQKPETKTGQHKPRIRRNYAPPAH